MSRPTNRAYGPMVVVLLCALGLAACRQDMHDAPRYEPFESSRFFADGRASRPVLEGTVARGQLIDDEHLATGRIGTAFAPTFPFEISAEILERGRERYDIYCSPCHDRTGSGNGMIVQRGFPRPRSFHEERLRQIAPGYVFAAITDGFGVMPSYAAQVPLEDRWAIVAYIRALQLSQNASVHDLNDGERKRLEKTDG